jgi:hypothetical protein
MKSLIRRLFGIVALQGCVGSDAGSQSGVAIQTSRIIDPWYYTGGEVDYHDYGHEYGRIHALDQ